MLNKINEFHLTIFICIISCILTYLGYTSQDPTIQEMSNRTIKLSTFMVYSFSLIKLLGTLKLDVWKEIIKEHNMALGLVLLGLLLGGAGCILL